MEKKGILYYTEVNESDIVLTGHHTSLTGLSRNLRDRLETVIEKSPLKLETRKFLISILLGDRSYLDPDIRRQFADAGVAHVLALQRNACGDNRGAYSLFLFFPLNFFGLYKWRLLARHIAAVRLCIRVRDGTIYRKSLRDGRMHDDSSMARTKELLMEFAASCFRNHPDLFPTGTFTM